MSFDLAAALKDVSNSDTGREQIEYISLSLIDEDPNNFYQLTDIPLLADNISLCGLQQPIRVRQQENGRYIIVSGHRRRAALEMLVADGHEQWKEAPCIVERDEVSPALQQLRLIYANANTRKMTSAEISEQAEQVEKLLYQLKEEGYDFPGRMRDHVAEAVGHSKSKLARLKVIRENLAAVWVDAWKDGTIGESVAYNLSQMPKSWQGIIHNVWGEKANRLYADTVANAKGRFQKVTKIQCEHGLTLCEHTVTMMKKNCKEMYYAPCTGCCFDCSSLQTCKNCCPQAISKQKEMKATAKQANLDAKREQEERDRPLTEFCERANGRVEMAREHIGMSAKSLMQKAGYRILCPYPPFGTAFNISEMMHLAALADALQCSVDYLLGRTEDRQSHLNCTVEESPVPYQGTTWQTADPPEPGKYLLMLKDGGCDPQYEEWEWDGMGWHDWSGAYDSMIDGEIKGWIPMPKLPEKPKPVSNESCITGMSLSGHCGAAAYCSNECTCCLQCPDDSCNGRCGWIEENA